MVVIAFTSVETVMILSYNTIYIYVLIVGGFKKMAISYKKLWKLLIADCPKNRKNSHRRTTLGIVCK